jgi:hypothetical protein
MVDGAGDWAFELCPELGGLSTEERARLASHFARLGAMEHASVAAFARFAMQLLELGAPSELLEEAITAQQEEREHARLCFGLASAYAGKKLGPGPLRTSDAFGSLELRGVFELVVLEGCIGESAAALEALEESRTAKDPVVAEVFARIASDETRHAALAWRFVSWAMTRKPGLERLLVRLVEGECQQATRSSLRPLRRDALLQVVLPASRSLLASFAA